MISLIITVLNERENLPEWLVHIKNQTLWPEEIIIVDGGSIDGTWEWLQSVAVVESGLKIYQKTGNIATGRNFAIQQARGDMIVATDAGCIYDPDWLKNLVATLANGKIQFAATAFGPWFKTSDKMLIYLLAAATIPASQEFKKDWLPSSRSVAFTKELWQNVGGYPEWIPICEDVIFNLKIKKIGIIPEYIRKPLVFWRPRTSLKSYFKQLSRYTRSDGHGKLWLKRQIIRYVTYISALIILFFSWRFSWFLIFLIIGGAAIYLEKFWQRWLTFTTEKSLAFRLVGIVLIPAVILLGDLAKMIGWPRGVIERWTGQIIFEQ